LKKEGASKSANYYYYYYSVCDRRLPTDLLQCPDSSRSGFHRPVAPTPE